MKTLPLSVFAAAAIVSWGEPARADDQNELIPPVAPPSPITPPEDEKVGKTVLTSGDLDQDLPRTTTPSDQPRKPNAALLTLGLGALGLTYGLSIVSAAVSPREADQNLYIPIVGPWIDLSDRGCNARPCGDGEASSKALLV